MQAGRRRRGRPGFSASALAGSTWSARAQATRYHQPMPDHLDPSAAWPPAATARPRPAARLAPLALAALALVLAGWLVTLAGCLEAPAVKEPTLPTGTAGTVARALLPSVVDVRASGGGIEEGRVAIGTGVIVEQGGFVVTNDHVLTGNGEGLAAEVEVVVDGGERVDATIVGRDPAMDLALLQVERDDLPVAEFFRRDARVGQYVLAIGAPRTLDDGFASGTVTALDDNIRVPGRSAISALLETDAPLLPGYSGGPVADRKGRVLGISIGTTVGEGEGRAYAIPAADVLRTVRRLLRRSPAAVTPADLVTPAALVTPADLGAPCS